MKLKMSKIFWRKKKPRSNPYMTIEEWDKNEFYTIWSIHDEKSESYKYYNDLDTLYKYYKGAFSNYDLLSKAYGQIELDLRAPDGVPDGMYPVYHKGCTREGGKLVVVQDGCFVPVPTEASIFDAICRSYDTTTDAVIRGKDGIDHVFIEDMVWDDTNKSFDVMTGS